MQSLSSQLQTQPPIARSDNSAAPLRVLHLLNHVQEIGNGIVNVAIDLACLQAQAGYEVSVASAGGEYESLLSQHGVRHFQLDQRRTVPNLWPMTRQYQQLVQTVQPQIVHAHMMTGAVLAWLLRSKSGRLGSGRSRRQSGQNYTIVSTVHNEFQRSAILMGFADRVIAVSQAVATSMQQRGIAAEKLEVVRNGTLGSPRDRHSEAPFPAEPLHRPAIATIAGLYHRKGIAELIAAFAQVATEFPTAHLYLIGNGPDRAEFEQQAATTGFGDRIHFEGYQPQPARYLAATDIFVLASRREPFGLVLSEARQAGCAIVATQVDGIPEALDNGAAGQLVPVGDATAIAQALRSLLSNPALLAEWQRRAQQNTDWLRVDRVCEETLAVYQQALTSRSQ